MKIRNISTLAAGLLLTSTLMGQVAAGRLIRMSEFSISDMMQFSQYDYSFGTARSAAMGGAFTALGADISCMSLNPAGLGMYRSSEFSFSPSITWTNTSSSTPTPSSQSFPGYRTNSNTNYTRFTFGSIGVALNVYQSTGPVTSVTIGFGYNKLADFNHTENIGLDAQQTSITDIFSKQVDGIPANRLSQLSDPFTNPNIAPNQWGAVAGYQSHAIEEYDRENHLYMPNLWRIDNDTQWAVTNNNLKYATVGSIGEYAISAGLNLNNIIYMGFTVGIQDIYFRQRAYYSEEYEQPDVPTEPKLNYLKYNQQALYAGSGVNFKFGIIARPVSFVRLALAVHTPTYVSLDSEYHITNMYTEWQDGGYMDEDVYSNYLVWNYKYSSPTRLTAGASILLGKIGVISGDYEVVWYNGMRLLNDDEYKDAIKEDVKYAFKPAQNYRAGIEIKPVPMLALRAGYSYTGSGLSDAQDLYPTESTPLSMLDNPVSTKTTSLSFGAGYRYNNFSFDLAYIYSKYEYTKYTPYWYSDAGGSSYADPVDTSMNRNILTMTMGFRF